jgi:lysophospholipase L1-like esterase
MGCSLLLSLALAEAVVRLVYGSPLHFRSPQPRYVTTEYGYKLEPRQRSFIGDSPLVVNDHGFRDHAWDVPKPVGRRRLLILGDSMPFGYHVAWEDTFGKVLERRLERSSPEVEVLVAAISGWDTATELAFLKAEGLELEPDLVVLCVFINDFGGGRPFDTSAAVAGQPVDTRPRWSRWMSEDTTLWLKRSALVFFVRSRFEWALAALHDRFLEPEGRKRNLEDRLMTNVDDEGTRAAMEATKSMILEMAELVGAHGADLAIAFMPNYEIFSHRPGSLGFVRALRRFSSRHRIEFIDTSDAFWAYGKVDDLYLRPWDNAHFSALGHELVAENLLTHLGPRLSNARPVTSNRGVDEGGSG